jgi:hypothetical protein
MLDDRLRPRRRAAALLLGLTLTTGACGMTGACGDPTEAGAPEPAGLTGGWSTAGCEFRREIETTSMGDITMPVTPADLAAAMGRVEEAGRTEFAESYAGLEVDQLAVRAIVYRVPSAAFDDFIRRTAENTCFHVRDAAHAHTELAAWQDRLTADLKAWSAHGVDIFTLAARHDGAGVEVGVRDVAQAKVQLLTRYGRTAPLIFVEQGPVTPLSTGSPAGPAEPPAAPQPGG